MALTKGRGVDIVLEMVPPLPPMRHPRAPGPVSLSHACLPLQVGHQDATINLCIDLVAEGGIIMGWCCAAFRAPLAPCPGC